MKRYLFIGIGGIIGSLTRYLFSNFIVERFVSDFPINTLIINVTGCFILGFFLTSVLEFVEIDSNYRLAISTGFVGSYTTFSTFTNEVNILLIKQKEFVLLIYIVCSLVVGILSIWLGTMAARKYFCANPDIECED